jgi:hypothetical protein
MNKLIIASLLLWTQSTFAAAPPDVAGVTFAMTPSEAELALKQKFGSFEKIDLIDATRKPIGSKYYFPRKLKDPKKGEDDANLAWNQSVSVISDKNRITEIKFSQFVQPCPSKMSDLVPALKNKYSSPSEGIINDTELGIVWHYRRSGALNAAPGALECDNCGGGVATTARPGFSLYDGKTGKANSARAPNFLCASPWSGKFYEEEEDCGYVIGVQSINKPNYVSKERGCEVSMTALDIIYIRDKWNANQKAKPVAPKIETNKAQF